MTEPMKLKEFLQAEGAQDWRIVSDGACAFYRTGSLAEAARFVQAMSAIPGIEDHPPAVDVRHEGVTVRLVTLTSEYMGMTRLDLELARLIAETARELGLIADASAIQSVLIIPGAPDIKQVMPFWRAVLGYDPRPDSPDEDLVVPLAHAERWAELLGDSRLVTLDGVGHALLLQAPDRVADTIGSFIEEVAV